MIVMIVASNRLLAEAAGQPAVEPAMIPRLLGEPMPVAIVLIVASVVGSQPDQLCWISG